MRGLDRNKVQVYYRLYMGETEVTDSDGYKTGQFTASYSSPTPIKACISTQGGSREMTEYGLMLPYTHLMLVDDANCPITEQSLVYVMGTIPTYQQKAYVKGDRVRTNNGVFEANQNITAEAWNASHWDEIKQYVVLKKVPSLKSSNNITYQIKEVRNE